MIIIPAIDIYEDKIVRLSKGSFEKITFYDKTPLEQAEEYEKSGFEIIHIVDLLGSKTGELRTLNIINKIKESTDLRIEFGGGIRNKITADILFSAGIDFLIIGSLIIKNEKEFRTILENHSPEKIIAAADIENEIVKISGWTEKTSLSLNSFIELCLGMSIRKFICTDIARDGMLTGPNLNLYKKIMSDFPSAELIASGGIKDIDDVKRLKELNPYAAVVGKAIYENKINLKELVLLA